MVKFAVGLVLGLFLGMFLVHSFPTAMSEWFAWLPLGGIL